MAVTHLVFDERLSQVGLLDKTTRNLVKNHKNVILQNPKGFRSKREELKGLTLEDLKRRAVGAGLEGWEGQSRKTEAFRVRIAIAEILLESKADTNELRDMPVVGMDWEEFSVEQLKDVCKENKLFCPAQPVKAYLVAILTDFFGGRRQDALKIKFWSEKADLVGLRKESIRLGIIPNRTRRTDRWAFDYIGASLLEGC